MAQRHVCTRILYNNKLISECTLYDTMCTYLLDIMLQAEFASFPVVENNKIQRCVRESAIKCR